MEVKDQVALFTLTIKGLQKTSSSLSVCQCVSVLFALLMNQLISATRAVVYYKRVSGRFLDVLCV